MAHLKNDENLFNKAFEQYEKALEINPYETYNFACYFSIKNQKEFTKEKLLIAEKHNTIPSIAHLSSDSDLDNIRNEQWFMELIERLKEKEEITKKAS